MPRRTKPGVNWTEIEQKVRAGQSTTSLAKEHGLARQSIDKRAKKEGWKDGPQRWLPAARQTQTSKALESPQTTAERHMATTGIRSAENAAAILDKLSRGVPFSIAPGAIGISYETFLKWRKDDPTFDRLVWQARQDHLSNQYGNIAKASDRGDWKAAQAMLQAAPETRKDWSANNAGAGGITVNIAIRAGEELPVVDVTPQQDTEES